jgi:hypothetical protein
MRASWRSYLAAARAFGITKSRRRAMLSLDYWIMRTAKMLETQTDQLRSQIEALLREYPDLADDDILRADMLEGETDIREIVTSINRMIEDGKALKDGTQARLDDLSDRRARFQKRIDFGRDLIRKILEAAQISKLELPEVTASLKNNPQQLIGDPDPNVLPDELVKITRAPDRAKIKEALARGLTVPGFTLSNAPPSLSLRVK